MGGMGVIARLACYTLLMKKTLELIVGALVAIGFCILIGFTVANTVENFKRIKVQHSASIVTKDKFPTQLLSEWVQENPRPPTEVVERVLILHIPMDEEGEWVWMKHEVPVEDVPSELLIDAFATFMPMFLEDLSRL